jgi:pimeloyl-ACP methyl ester carboxylesterase
MAGLPEGEGRTARVKGKLVRVTVLAVSVTAFSFPNDEGLPIRGDFQPPERVGGPVVVCVHGFKGFKDWGFWPETASRLWKAGYGVVRFNFSHSGVGPDFQTFSEPELFETGTYTREVEDLREVLSRLAARGFGGPQGPPLRSLEHTPGRLPGGEVPNVSRMGLLAHSRGAISALAVAASGEFPVRSVALWNPVSSVSWWDEEVRERWRKTGFREVVNTRTGQVFRVKTTLLDDAEGNRGRLDPVGNAERLRVPLLSVVAAADESVAPASGRRLASAAGPLGSLSEIAGTGHTFGAAHPFPGPTPALEEAILATREHFDRTLSGASS